MTMWDDLMNTFNFAPDNSSNNHTSDFNNHHQQHLKLQTRAAHSSGSQPSSPCSQPGSPHVFQALQTSTYRFPAQSSMPLSASVSNGEARQQQQQPSHRHLTRSNSTKDLKREEYPSRELEAAILAPQMRQRVYTYAGATADHPSVVPVPVPAENSSLRRGIGPNKRRATCPDSMRNYPRGRGARNAAGELSAPKVVASTSAAQQKQQRNHQRNAFPKIEDVDSDISDETEAQLDFHSSGDASTASDMSYESHIGTTELCILRQPESHHRARYQKEGSRGCIKDRTGNSCPALQLRNYVGPTVVLQAFIGTENGPVRPHPLYRVCKVGGKHSTPCRERILESGITTLEMDMTRDNNYILNVDCLGIMKLRNADFEQVFEAEDLAKRRKRSPKVRLVFRAVLTLTNGKSATLQIISTPICCTPSPGVPEIHFISHPSCPAVGGTDIVVIGRNFVKDDSRLYIVEKNQDDVAVWEREVPLLQENFNQVHLVGSLPPYRDQRISKPVELSLYVRNKGGKQSEPQRLLYMPDEAQVHVLSFPPAMPPTPPQGTSQQLLCEPPTSTVTSTPYPGILNASISNMPTLPVIQLPQTNGSQEIQYCIQLPGSLQPLIITVPHAHILPSDPFIVGAQLQQSPPQETQRHRNNSQESLTDSDYGGGGAGQSGFTSNFESTSTPPNLSGGSSCRSLVLEQDLDARTLAAGMGASDEDLFDELLKEILGTGDQTALADFGLDAAGPSSSATGPFINAYHSPVQSPSTMAALSAARSFRAMDIRGSEQTLLNNNYLLEENQDDLMN
ncbi:Nuclear factor of activated T-cells 5 [Hypsibius exemplaris]|uniref:Nuclear factor of activated T-cells 5 n=1 Tax=Hypsibius exemplaris TaxID=2072580 RepID=A0A1W0X5J4_HYPEX|nr:Nuclear factor of activated T-cells 5 [Hypsibius exemplaris]